MNQLIHNTLCGKNRCDPKFMKVNADQVKIVSRMMYPLSKENSLRFSVAFTKRLDHTDSKRTKERQSIKIL